MADLTPEELRALSTAGKKERRAKAKAQAKAESAKERIAREKLQANVPQWIKNVEYGMKQSAREGNDSASIRFTTVGYTDSQRMKEPCRALRDHFAKFDATVTVDNPMEWGSDGAGPGPDYHYYLNVKW